MRFGLLRFAETDMFNTVVGILLILIVGMCVAHSRSSFGCCLAMDLGPGTRAIPLARVGTAPRVLPAGVKITKKPRRDMTRLMSKAASIGR
jgi:hypothetical protein